jgi:hypothetical protein
MPKFKIHQRVRIKQWPDDDKPPFVGEIIDMMCNNTLYIIRLTDSLMLLTESDLEAIEDDSP